MAVKLIKIPTSDRWYATWCTGGRSCRISTRTTVLQDAQKIAAEIEAGLGPSHDAAALSRIGSRAYAQAMLTRLQAGHKLGKPRRACHLTLDFLHTLLIASEGRCAVSGLPLSFERPRAAKRNPWAPSLDRINSRRPYEPGNVRIVCAAANLAMQDWGYGVLLRLAEAVTTDRRRARDTQIPEFFGSHISGESL
jgi:hypothetical protein